MQHDTRQNKQQGRPQHGFTLIESVVSLLLLAVMSMMSYQAVEVILSANQRSRNDLAEEIRLHRAWQIITNDLMHLRARLFSDGFGSVEPAYETGRGALVSFSRGNGALQETNPTGISRVRYQLNESNEFLRSSQPIFLSPRNTDVRPQILLTSVKEVLFEQLSSRRDFEPVWPPLNASQSILTLPRMIKVTITLEDGNSTSRLFPGVDNGVL